MTSRETLDILLAGNTRFVSGHIQHPHQGKNYRDSLVTEQHPRAAILSCSDSRATPEIITDQGLGDLFTIRTAGEVLDDAVTASLEFAVEELGVDLLMVLGHENCGAIGAALTAPSESSVILDQVGRSIAQARASGLTQRADFERTHARRIATEIPHHSTLLATAIENGTVGLMSGRYLLGSGRIEVLETIAVK